MNIVGFIVIFLSYVYIMTYLYKLLFAVRFKFLTTWTSCMWYRCGRINAFLSRWQYLTLTGAVDDEQKKQSVV